MIARRLSFSVGVSSSPPGSHSFGRIAKRLTRSARERPRVGGLDRGADGGTHLGVSGERGHGCVVDAVLGGELDGGVGVEGDQRGDVRAAVADRGGVARSAVSPPRCATSTLAGEMFLPPAVTISSFLRSTIET